MTHLHIGTLIRSVSTLAALASVAVTGNAAAQAAPCPNTININGYGHTNPPYAAKICSGVRYGRHSDIALGDTQRLDIILPSHKPGPYPVIVAIHGGGFGGGNRRLDINGDGTIQAVGVHPVQEDYIGLLRQVIRGFAVVSVDYRLATQFDAATQPRCGLPPVSPIGTEHFPIPLYDVKQAIRWIKANASKYKLNTSSIATWGGSAGANLAAMVGGTSAQGFFEPPASDLGTEFANLANQTSTTGLTIAMAGPHDFTQNMYYVSDINPPPPASDPRWVGAVCAEIAASNYLNCDLPLGGNLVPPFSACTNAAFPISMGAPPNTPVRLAASSINYLAGPPVYLQHSHNDMIVHFNHSQAYFNALVAAGRPAALRVLPDSAGHGSGNPADFRDYCDANGCVSAETDFLLAIYANGPQP